jgi:hypothetical protein
MLRPPKHALQSKPILLGQDAKEKFRRELVKTMASVVVDRCHREIVASNGDGVETSGKGNGKVENVLETTAVDDCRISRTEFSRALPVEISDYRRVFVVRRIK